MEDVKKINSIEFPNKKNILLINKINIFNFVILILFKIYFNKIFFLETDRWLRNKKILSFLEIFGLNWINYSYYDLENVHSNTVKKTTLFCDKYSIYISKNIWINSLSIFFLNKDLLTACINSKIKENIMNIYEMMEVAQLLQKKNQVSLIMSNNFFFRTINKNYNLINLNIFNYDIFKCFSFIFTIFFKICLIIYKKVISVNFCKKKNKNQKYKENKFKVAFFPHKGMFTQNNVKDYFYLKKTNSNFNQKKIAHIEWSKSDLNKQSHKYYFKNKISLFFWDSFKKKNIMSVLKFFIFKFKLLFKLYRFSILIEILSSAYQVHNARQMIANNFPKLKYILVGYDLLFPVEISIASKYLDIKTIAIQDRLLHPSWSHKMCFDYYFLLGQQSKKVAKERMGKTIKNLNKTQISKIDNFNIKKNKKHKSKTKCLVVDFSSLEEKKWYSNGRSILGNWKTNCNFYYEVVSLSKKYPNILFLIKSKNYFWLKNNYFKDLVKILNKQKNIKILKNQKKWTPEYSIKFADFAISRYSSLSDQMFYLNKPTLIFNYNGYPGSIFDFGDKILVNNLNQLENKINLIEKDYHHYNKSLQQIRRRLFYYNIKGNPIKDLLISFDNKLINKKN